MPPNIPSPAGKHPYPSGPPFLPRLLNGSLFRENAAQFMLQSAHRYGDLVHYKAFGRHVYQLNHPDLIEDFFLKDAAKHHRNLVMQRGRAVLGNGLLTSEDPLHMRQRRLAQPAFHRSRIAAYAEVIATQAEAMTARWHSGSTRDLREEMLALALRIVGECLFGLRLDDSPDARARIAHISASVSAFMGFLPLAFLPFPELIQRLPLPPLRRIRQGRAQLDALIYGMIRERRQTPADPLAQRGDLLSLLMAGTDSEAGSSAKQIANGMSDEQLRDECLTILLAGHETTANALSFALWLLARHPEIQAAVSAEARAVLGSRTPQAADYARLPYTTQVFAETLRLYPPVWVTARTCAEPYEIAGYPVPRGAAVIAPQFAVHRDPRFFPDPLRFDPSRFSENAKAGRPRMSYFPFAAGSRQCIGEGLAWMEGVFVLAVIARNWRLSLPPGAPTEIDYEPSISLRPRKPVSLHLEALDDLGSL